MKTRANNELEGRSRKRRRLNEAQEILQIQSMLPFEVWVEIFKYLNKKQLREIASVSKECYGLTKMPTLFQEAPWPPLDYRNVIKNIVLPIHVSFHEHYSFSNGAVAFAKKAIYLWHPFKSDYIKLKGHKGHISDMIYFDDKQLVSCDQSDIRIWKANYPSKLLYQVLHQQKSFAIFLIALRDEKFACIYKNGVVDVWDRFKGQYIGPLLKDTPIPNVQQMKKLNGQLILVHSATLLAGFKGGNQIISVWGLDDGLLKMTLKLANYRDNLVEFIKKNENDKSFIAKYLVGAPLWNELSDEEKEKSCCSFLDISHDGHYLIRFYNYIFLLNKNGQFDPLFLGVEVETKVETVKYTALKNGLLAVMSKTCLGFEFFADYDPILNEFRIKHSFFDPDADLFHEYLLMQDGSVVMKYRGLDHLNDSNISNKWSMATQALVPGFELHGHETPSGQPEPPTLYRLPTGDILGCYYRGEIVIWDGQSGEMKNQFTASESRYNYANDLTGLLDNGDLLIEWVNTAHPDYERRRHKKMIRFGLFDDKVPENSGELDVTKKQVNTLKM